MRGTRVAVSAFGTNEPPIPWRRSLFISGRVAGSAVQHAIASLSAEYDVLCTPPRLPVRPGKPRTRQLPPQGTFFAVCFRSDPKTVEYRHMASVNVTRPRIGRGETLPTNKLRCSGLEFNTWQARDHSPIHFDSLQRDMSSRTGVHR